MTDIKTRSGLLSHTDTQLANGSGSITPAKHRDLVKSLINSMATLDEVTLRVTNMTTTTPPGSPSDRDKYVVGSGASGDWSGQDDNIAIYDANASPAGWYFVSVTDGLGVWNLADDTEYRWDAGASPAAWTAQGAGGSSTLSGLSDTTITSPSNGQVLKYNGSAWINDTDATGGSSLTGDIYYPYVSALLHGDGTDAATTFTDHGPQARTYTANGDAQIDTAQSKFGGASMLFDGTGDYLSSANNAVFLLGNGPFTVESWVRFNSVASTQRFAGVWNGGAAQRSWLWRWNTTNQLQFVYSTDGSASTTVSWPWTPSTGTWYHVAVVRHRNTLRAFVDGTEIGSATAASATFFASTAAFEVGGVETTEYFNGWMDDLRLTKGVARYWQNFTAPTAAFGNGAAY